MNKVKSIAAIAFAALTVFMSLSVGVGPAAAAAGNTDIANQTVSVDSDTRSVYADIDASNNSADTNVQVEFIPVKDGNESAAISRTVTATAGSTTVEEYQQVNATEYDSYRVVVTADNTTNTTASVGKLQKVAGGSGGGLLGGESNTPLLVGVLAVVGILGVVLKE